MKPSEHMRSLMQHALGDDWERLPHALQTHYLGGETVDVGHLDIEYPVLLQPLLHVLRLFGALINRRGKNVPTVVRKTSIPEVPHGNRQYWQRTMTFPDGRQVYFNSFWVASGADRLIEFVNPVLGLEMSVQVRDTKLYYEGKRFIVKLGGVSLPIPEWLLLGHTTIVEEAIDNDHFAMDFRMTHPLFGLLFRYAGNFQSTAIQLRDAPL